LEDPRSSQNDTQAADKECPRGLLHLDSELVDEPFRPEAWRQGLVGQSPQIQQIVEIIRLVAARRATVLITGESGTGKELAARALHLASPRRYASWVAVNCSALPEALIEAELFGYVRGAFTGALQSRVGRFEQAHGGTLFLDEIGELPLVLQAKILRVLQEREFQRLGSSETIRVDVRVVAATNCDLAARIEDGRFREDLYYRLNVVPLPMPALRHRKGDIPILARYLIGKICAAEGLPVKLLTTAALAQLQAETWPGNVRQLENALEMAIALSGDRLELTESDFPPLENARSPEISSRLPRLPEAGLNYEETLVRIERSILEQALRRTGGNKKAAAEMLGLKRTTLAAKVRSLGGVALCG
jgi:transcriptional regulator with GAF, ATPase, and Fis domain